MGIRTGKPYLQHPILLAKKETKQPQNQGPSKRVEPEKPMGAISKLKPKSNQGVSKKKQKANNYEETWSCSKCTLINSIKNQVCILCGASYLNTKEQQNSVKAEEEKVVTRETTPTIFDTTRDGNEEEEMPQKGNVLDRVVQFTAMQMLATDRQGDNGFEVSVLGALLRFSDCW